MLAQGIKKAVKETTDLAEDCLVLTSFPREHGTQDYLRTGWKMTSI